MANWRPVGWQNPYPKTIVDECSGIEVDSGKYPIFEAGGDAMLKALLESQDSQPTIIHDLVKGEKRVGISVFIPDEVGSFPLVCGSCHTRHSPEEACPPRSKEAE
jgi:hypothetical protein